MSQAVLLSPHITREDLYHEALEVFLNTSARYLDLDIRQEMEADPGAPHAPALYAGDLYRGEPRYQPLGS